MIADVVAVPIKKDDVAGRRNVAAVLPLSLRPEPRDSCIAVGEFREGSGFDIPALVGYG